MAEPHGWTNYEGPAWRLALFVPLVIAMVFTALFCGSRPPVAKQPPDSRAVRVHGSSD